MSELNREQVIKALEWWTKNFDGKVTDFKTLCEATLLINELTQSNEQLSESYDHLEKTKDELLSERSRLCIELEAMRAAANSYKMHIAEITKENEKLRADIAKEFTCVFGQPHKVTDCPIDDEIAKAKADTVRKMVERLKERNKIYCVNESDRKEMDFIIDQIAKELLEGV